MYGDDIEVDYRGYEVSLSLLALFAWYLNDENEFVCLSVCIFLCESDMGFVCV